MPKNAGNQWTWDHCIQNRSFFQCTSHWKKLLTPRIPWKDRRRRIRTVNTDDVEKLLNLVHQKVEPKRDFFQCWIVAHSILLTMIYEHTSQNTVQKWLATYVKWWILRFELQKDVFLPNMVFLSSFDWNEFPATLPSRLLGLRKGFFRFYTKEFDWLGDPVTEHVVPLGRSTQLNSTPIKFPYSIGINSSSQKKRGIYRAPLYPPWN